MGLWTRQLCTEPDTRSAIHILRETLDRYADKKESIGTMRAWRQLTINLLRQDLDLGPAYELPDQEYESLIHKLKASLEEQRKMN